MIKPGPRDVKLHIRIAGAELDELQRFTRMMVEAFGLDRRIERYQGKRPIGLWRWDVECLLEVMNSTLADPRKYRSQEEPGYLVLKGLRARLQQAYDETYPEFASNVEHHQSLGSPSASSALPGDEYPEFASKT